MQTTLLSSHDFIRQAPTSLPEWLPPSARIATKPRGPAAAKSSLQPELATTEANPKRNESSRPKQSKSRSGCMTCKKKRIKCDEARPACGQCVRRNLECDGYKLNFKWRLFDDTAKPPPGAGKPHRRQNLTSQGDVAMQGHVQCPTPPTSLYLGGEPFCSSGLQSLCTYAPPADDPDCLPSAVEDDFITPPEHLDNSPFDLLSDLDSGFHSSDVELMSILPLSPSQSSGSFERAPDEEAIRNWIVSATPETDSRYSRDQGSPPTADFPNSLDYPQSMLLTPFHPVYLDHTSPEMLLLRFDRETCGVLSIKDGYGENPWRTIIRPMIKDCDVLYHAISAMAALHGATIQPRLRPIGTAHMSKAVSKLSAEMQNMSENQILASALALCIGEGWDDKISTGIQHLKGAAPVLSNALARLSRTAKQGQTSREEEEPLKFLSNTFVYLDAIARLTSSDDHGNIDLDNAIQAMNQPIDSEIDPLMGCATTLFPLLGKVASLVHRIRKTCSNSLSVIGEANELREQLLHWEPPDMYSFEEPHDPSSNVRHVLQTAEAYRRAILLHLHSAVAELSSEPSHDQAKSTLAMLAATPLSSRTMIVQIFPLLVGSCEMVQPEDRQWVAQRWEAMMKRLTLVNVSSCWKIVQEVWRRRDQWVETQPQQMRPTVGRSMSQGVLLTRTKRRSFPEAAPASDDVLASNNQERDGASRDLANQARDRSPASDVAGGFAPRRGLVRLPRNHTDISLLSGAVEYTVRGQLHWLGVMSDWNWKVFL